MSGTQADGPSGISAPIELFRNPRARPDEPYDESLREVLSRRAGAEALDAITAWPGYRATPLEELAGLARSIGIGRLWYKDESERFGLGSFKALGGPYAVQRLLAERVAQQTGQQHVLPADLLAGRFASIAAALTVTCATDGNHGRSVAWVSRLFGCRCVIYVHNRVSAARRAAIAAHGAELVVVRGTYDDSVRLAAADAARRGRLVVSDTSYPGYTRIPCLVMQGYTVMVEEIVRQLPAQERPTHVFVQGGVGGLAAAVCAHLWETWGADRPAIIIVEPDRADCLLASAKAGRPVVLEGDLDTIMAGLSCGEPSHVAWTVLERGVRWFLSIPDAVAVETMILLAAGTGGDRPVVAGESGAAGLGGLLAAAADPASRDALALTPDSRVLVFGTEGATDPEAYAATVGRQAAEVRAG